MKRFSKVRFAALATTMFSALLLPATASAFHIEDFSAAPLDPTAGIHSDVRIAMQFNEYPGDRVRNISLHLPPGLMGNPKAIPVCSQASFAADSCSPSSKVGTATTKARAKLGILPALKLKAHGDVYNVAPLNGEPARLGVVVRPPLSAIVGKQFISIPITMRSSDGGLDSQITDLPTKTGPAETWIESMEMVLMGLSPDRTAAFMTNPTTCLPATASIDAQAWSNSSTIHAQSTFTPTQCDSVKFNPSTTVTTETANRAKPSGYTVSLHFPTNDIPRREAHIKRAEVKLPIGTTLSPGIAAGLRICSPEQFAADSEAVARCAPETKIGTVSMKAPPLGTVNGQVFFGQPTSQNPYPLYVAINEHGVKMKFIGTTQLDPNNGQITTTFDNLPQVPLESFSLSFVGGDRALLANPARGGQYTTTARLTPWSSAPRFVPERDITTTAKTTISASNGDQGAIADGSFRPAISAGVTNAAAGGATGAFTLKMVVPDGDHAVLRSSIELPPGLAGRIPSVALCGEAQAASGTCGEESRIGSVSTVVGTGGAPATMNGRVYLTGPTGDAPFGMSIVVPASVGPIDLGTIVLRAGMKLRPSDGGLTVVTDALPRFRQGIPINVRELTLALDRPGFLINPTTCSPLAIKGSLTSVSGEVVNADAPFQAVGCGSLPFAPQIGGLLSAKNTPGKKLHPGLRTVITLPAGHATSKSLTVTLSKSLGIDPLRLASLCRGADFEQGTCPANTRVGYAIASTSLLGAPLQGPVHLVQKRAGDLPGMSIFLSGAVSMRLDGTVDLGQSISTTFNTVPDVPLERFEFSLDGGPNGLLVANDDPCAGKPFDVSAQFVGHNGKTAAASSKLALEGCRARPTSSVLVAGLTSKPVLRMAIRAADGEANLQEVRMTLPRQLRAAGNAAAKRMVVQADGKALPTSALKIGDKTELTITIPRGGARRVTMETRPGALVASTSIAKLIKARGSLAFTINTNDTAGEATAATAATAATSARQLASASKRPTSGRKPGKGKAAKKPAKKGKHAGSKR